MYEYSITKSFTSTAVGIAVEEGLISLQDKVIDYFKVYSGR
ncbi:serine hydrolase [Clostridium sulfidigenes]